MRSELLKNISKIADTAAFLAKQKEDFEAELEVEDYDQETVAKLQNTEREIQGNLKAIRELFRQINII